jgi:hypothetical protein
VLRTCVRSETGKLWRLRAPTCSHQGIEVIVQVTGDLGGMEDAVQLHQRLLQSGPLALIDCASAIRELLIPPKETPVFRSVLIDVVRG